MSNFKKEFNNTVTKSSVVFDENGITYKEERNKFKVGEGIIFHAFIPYNCINSIELILNTQLSITFYANERIRKISFWETQKQSFAMKSAIRFAKSQYKKSTYKGNVIIYDENAGGSLNETKHIMHCEDCGHIYHFTDDDLKKNREKIDNSSNSIFGAVTAGMSGNYLLSTMNSQAAQNSLNNIADYYSCPKCHSKNIKRISEAELASIKANESNKPTSSLDEIKKLKELLDIGVITQEEFDAKKKQLLGL